MGGAQEGHRVGGARGRHGQGAHGQEQHGGHGVGEKHRGHGWEESGGCHGPSEQCPAANPLPLEPPVPTQIPQGPLEDQSTALPGPPTHSPCHSSSLPEMLVWAGQPYAQASGGVAPTPPRTRPAWLLPEAHCHPASPHPPGTGAGTRPRAFAHPLPPAWTGSASQAVEPSPVCGRHFMTVPPWCTPPPPRALSGAPLWRGAPGGTQQTILSQFPRPLTAQPPGL